MNIIYSFFNNNLNLSKSISSTFVKNLIFLLFFFRFIIHEPERLTLPLCLILELFLLKL